MQYVYDVHWITSLKWWETVVLLCSPWAELTLNFSPLYFWPFFGTIFQRDIIYQASLNDLLSCNCHALLICSIVWWHCIRASCCATVADPDFWKGGGQNLTILILNYGRAHLFWFLMLLHCSYIELNFIANRSEGRFKLGVGKLHSLKIKFESNFCIKYSTVLLKYGMSKWTKSQILYN